LIGRVEFHIGQASIKQSFFSIRDREIFRRQCIPNHANELKPIRWAQTYDSGNKRFVKHGSKNSAKRGLVQRQDGKQASVDDIKCGMN
jgi:hypothetical protein